MVWDMFLVVFERFGMFIFFLGFGHASVFFFSAVSPNSCLLGGKTTLRFRRFERLMVAVHWASRAMFHRSKWIPHPKKASKHIQICYA